MPVEEKERCSPYDGMYYVHSAIRKDFKTFKLVLEKLEVSTKSTKSSWHRHNFVKYCKFHLLCVHSHHHIEDEIFFPFLRGKGCNVPETLTEEHHAISSFLTRFEKNLDVLDPNSKASDDELTNAVSDLKTMIPEFERMFLGHLSVEEEICFSFYLENVTKTEMSRDVIPKILAYLFKVGNAEMEMAWMLASDPVHEPDFLQELPLPPRLLYKNSWKARFNKQYAPLLKQILYSSVNPYSNHQDGMSCYQM